MAAAMVEESGNLSPVAASNRLRLGVIMLAAGLVMAVTFVKMEWHWSVRLLVFLPFFMAANGFYQGLYRT